VPEEEDPKATKQQWRMWRSTTGDSDLTGGGGPPPRASCHAHANAATSIRPSPLATRNATPPAAIALQSHRPPR